MVSGQSQWSARQGGRSCPRVYSRHLSRERNSAGRFRTVKGIHPVAGSYAATSCKTNLWLRPNGPDPRLDQMPLVAVLSSELTLCGPMLARRRNKLAWILHSQLSAWSRRVISFRPSSARSHRRSCSFLAEMKPQRHIESRRQCTLDARFLAFCSAFKTQLSKHFEYADSDLHR